MSKIGDVFGGGGGGGEAFSLLSRVPGLLETKRARDAAKKKAEEDRELEGARKRAREAEKLRKGRQASILTSSRGVTEPLGTANRPRASSLLGGG